MTGNLRVKIFADGADKNSMLKHYTNQLVAGFTTNPTLMRKAGVSDYCQFARDVLTVIKDRPISFEVFSDEFPEMERQAKLLAAMGANVYVKIPITNSHGESSIPLVERISAAGIKVNVTAMTSAKQVRAVTPALASGCGGCVSVMAGRVADSGRDPLPVMKECVGIARSHANVEVIWASPREVLNVIQASEIDCHIITVTDDILKKLEALGTDLDRLSLDLVQMFHRDAKEAQFVL